MGPCLSGFCFNKCVFFVDSPQSCIFTFALSCSHLHAMTALFKLKALKPALITPQGPNVSALMTMGLVVLVSQAALAILFKVIFFQYIAIASGGAPAGSSGPKNGTAT